MRQKCGIPIYHVITQTDYDVIQELGAAKENESRLSNQVQALQQSLDGALQRNKTLEADLSDREETIVAKENAADSYSLILQSAVSIKNINHKKH